jgi:hypothetical protein
VKENKKMHTSPFNDLQHKLVGSKGRAEMIEILIKIKSHRKVRNSIKGNAT